MQNLYRMVGVRRCKWDGSMVHLPATCPLQVVNYANLQALRCRMTILLNTLDTLTTHAQIKIAWDAAPRYCSTNAHTDIGRPSTWAYATVINQIHFVRTDPLGKHMSSEPFNLYTQLDNDQICIGSAPIELIKCCDRVNGYNRFDPRCASLWIDMIIEGGMAKWDFRQKPIQSFCLSCTYIPGDSNVMRIWLTNGSLNLHLRKALFFCFGTMDKSRLTRISQIHMMPKMASFSNVYEKL